VGPLVIVELHLQNLQDALTFSSMGLGCIVTGILYIVFAREALTHNIKMLKGAERYGVPAVPLFGAYYFELRWLGGFFLVSIVLVLLAGLAWPAILKLDALSFTTLTWRLSLFLIGIAAFQIISYKTGAESPGRTELGLRLLFSAALLDFCVCSVWLEAYLWWKICSLVLGLILVVFFLYRNASLYAPITR